MKKNILYLVVSLCFLLSSFSLSFAEDKITILVSGQSHSSLYPCNCPGAPIGGVARRATLINKVKSEENSVLVLEAGGSFAGGSYDINSQTTELDKERTEFYMQSLVKMDYDAFLISSEEFNFGEDFLKEVMSTYKLNYLSANIKGDFQPYLTKDIGNVKVAIIGVTDERVKNKSKTEYIKPQDCLLKAIEEIKGDKEVSLVIVLSYLGEKESKELLNKIAGIDIWIDSNNPFMIANSIEISGTLFVQPAWETRTLTKINLSLAASDSKEAESSGLISFEVENIKLSEDIEDDTQIASFIPECFTDKDCRKSGYVGKCESAATKESKCVFSEIKSAKLIVIKPTKCNTCNIESTIERIEKILPNLEVEYFLEDTPEAKELIENLNINMLPAYLVDKSIEEETIISQIGQIANEIDNYYMLEPGFTGVSYYIKRKEIPNRLDVFFDIGTKDIVKILDILQILQDKNKDIDIHLNFLAIEDIESGFIAKAGKYEIEEYLRSACINKYYPDKLRYYLSCRLSDIESSWWDDCVSKFGMDPGIIKGCAQTQEGKILLREFIKLTQELEVVFGPTFLVNNKEIFSSEGVPSVEELEELFE